MQQRQLRWFAVPAILSFMLGGSAGASELRADQVTALAVEVGPRALASQLGAGALRSVQTPDPVNVPQPNIGQTLPDAARADEVKEQKGLGIATLVISTVVLVAVVWALVAFVLRRTWST